MAFTITMVFVVSCLLSSSLWAAEKIDFHSGNANEYIRLLNENDSRDDLAIGPLFGLTANEKFTLLRQRTDLNEVTHYRYQQLYKGIPVWGIQTVISRDASNKVVRLHGAMIKGSPNDVKDIPTPLDALGALRQMQELHKEKDKGAVWSFENERFGTYIYLHKNNKAHLCYVVSFFADTEFGNPSQPIHFIEVKTGKVLHSYDMLRYHGVGPGGNYKVGCYYYGIDYPPFCVTEVGGTCTMNCPDVKTVDLNHGTSGSTAFSFTCHENDHKTINGAYSPLNDAQYFGYVVFDMYNDWFYVDPLPFQLMMRCHYSTNYENAFWNGSSMTFGDGYTTFYPLVALDVVAHEVSHGFTQFNSNLIYSGESGGINEAFSDMAGEGAKYHSRGVNDFLVGHDIFKNPTGALRYMCDPPLDGVSIDHVSNYFPGMDVHYSSGIFNKAFCLIANSSGWNTRMAFSIFVKANQDYWTPSTTFQQGAEGARDAALDYGYPCQDVLNAFAAVGITLTCPGSAGYCASSASSQTFEYIAGVQVGGLNNPSGSAPYSDFTWLPPTDLTRGSTVNVTLTPGFPARPYVECWKIRIDYNRDNDFDDPDEEVFTGSGDLPVTGSFNVPCCCMVGETRMRVSMSYINCPPYCGLFTYGEVEDYTVNIL
jgi:pseudolysin/vibriolysin